jgi:hypothetical protein
MPDFDGIPRRPKLNQEEDEDDFDWKDWKKEVEENQSTIYAVYMNKNIPEVTIQILNDFGFKWNGHFWENTNGLNKDEISSLEEEGIVVQKN